MYPTTDYPSSAPRFAPPAHSRETFDAHEASRTPQDIRPLITRHRLRRQRRRKAATLLTGASIALGVAALRPSNAAAHSGAASQVPITHTDRHAVQDPALVHYSAHAPIAHAAQPPAQNPVPPHYSAEPQITQSTRHPVLAPSLPRHSAEAPIGHAAQRMVQNPDLVHHSAPD
jgi:hypothetical protein